MTSLRKTNNKIVCLNLPQLDSPSPNKALYKLCIQNASQTHIRVSSSQIPWPI